MLVTQRSLVVSSLEATLSEKNRLLAWLACQGFIQRFRTLFLTMSTSRTAVSTVGSFGKFVSVKGAGDQTADH